MPESPREIFLAACTEIAARFSDRGFRFAKSGPHARKKAGDFTYQISFQSSHSNVAGASVKLSIHGTVFSKRLEAWRASHPQLRASDYVAGGQIGNLSDKAEWCDWDLADRNVRQSTIDSAVAAIESIAIAYFAQFDELDVLMPKLQQSDIPSMTIDNVIEFLLCFADHERAKTAAVHFLHRRPDLAGSYMQEFQWYSERGLDSSRPSGYAKTLAFFSHLFQFGDLTRVF